MADTTLGRLAGQSAYNPSKLIITHDYRQMAAPNNSTDAPSTVKQTLTVRIGMNFQG